MKANQWYTYKLCYPSGTPFYFGKVLKNSVFQHKRQATTDFALRDRVINDILHRGSDITLKIIEYCNTEKEAFRVARENIELFSETELLTNIMDNSVPHNWKKHKQQLGIPLRAFQMTTQAWPDEANRAGATLQCWEDDETDVIRKLHESRIKQYILDDAAVNIKEIEQAEKKNRMIAEYEKMIAEEKLRVRNLPRTNFAESEEEDEIGDETDSEEDETDKEEYKSETYSDEMYPEETECGYCGVVFSSARILARHYEDCIKKQKYFKTNNRKK